MLSVFEHGSSRLRVSALNHANNGNGNFTNTFQQHHSSAPGEQCFQGGGYWFMATISTQDATSIGGTQDNPPNMFKTPVREHENDLK